MASDFEQLYGRYESDSRIAQIHQQLSQSGTSRLQLTGIKGALDTFVLLASQQKLKSPFLFIADDKEAAAYLFNNLENLTKDNPILFLPDSFKRPTAFDQLNETNTLQRTEVINKVSNSKNNEIIITYPEALFEKVIAPKELKKAQITIEVNEKIDIDTIISVMVEYGFSREDFVYEPGQFSIRGGIVDIFSYGNEWPYRVDLFDDEVESIKTFDPLTQLSQKNIGRVSIVPNMNTQFNPEDKVSILKVLSENCVVWLQDFNMLLEKLNICVKKAEEIANQITSDIRPIQKLYEEKAFIIPGDTIKELEAFSTVFVSSKNLPFEPDEIVPFNVQPQPSFNKNFELLINQLKDNEKKGITNYIFTDNAKQIERFYAIFNDLNADVKFLPVMKGLSAGFFDLDTKVAVMTDHQIFERFHRFNLRKGFSKDKAISLKMLRELKPGDFVSHIDHGVGRYSGLEKIDINGRIQESVRLVYRNNDLLYVGINSLHKISKFVGSEGRAPKLNKLGSDTWKTMKSRTKSKVKDIAKELIKLYAQRKASEGHAFPPDGYLQNELEASFLYEDTPDQLTATNDVKEDMMKSYPMDRLICGDVGFGKTEIAIRAAFKAVVGGKQVAVLVPTTILALQHAKTFSERLGEFGVSVDYVNRFKTAKQKKEIFQKLKDGKLDLVIGTHAILGKDIGFKDLGLLIIDEEQKFGVAAKEKLRNIKVNVDTLTLTATPIPRTLQFSLMAARDLSIIRTAPPNRQPIHTEMRVFNNDLIKESIYYEIHRGGQVFFVHNRVKSLPDIAALVKRLCPDVDVAVAHGQMDPKSLERTLVDFIDRKYEVLVSTNIIETGLDIPNANTIIINNANQFGLSDLHQLRGRVGRSNKKAYCYLFSPPVSTLTPESRKRLRTLEEFSDLGSGFNIAMRDLDIRGAGNLLGGEQSGFITDIGYETYQKILEEAITELKENEYRDLFEEDVAKRKEHVRDVQIETDVEMHIPDNYVSNIQERLNLYTKLNKISSEEDLEQFEKMLDDRFGDVPKQVYELFDAMRLRQTCKELGFERVILKSSKLRLYFISNPQATYFDSKTFQDLMSFVTVHGAKHGLSLKQTPKYFMLIKPGVHTLKSTKAVLDLLEKEVLGKGVETA